jgi:uncharacterized membrane protein YhaH (DUF805 family)
MNWKEFYLSPKGRVTRKEWWQWLVLPIIVLILGTTILDFAFGSASRGSPLGILTTFASWLTIYPEIIVSVKRLHDHDKSGWWYLVYLVPIAGWVWIFIECGCLRGTLGDNRYGPDPLPPPYYMTAGPRAGAGRRDA